MSATILDRIILRRRERIAESKRLIPAEEMRRMAWESPPPALDFLAALTAPRTRGLPVIAEVKKASPSRGVIREDFQAVQIARDYLRGGASALSVLTEVDHFQGCDDYLRAIAREVPLPALRKDFIVEEYQIHEARALGASAFLLIVDCLEDSALRDFIELGHALSLTALVEVHRAEEAERALACGAEIIGINNRDLRTFVTRLETSLEIRKLIPPGIPVVSESGISSAEDLARLKSHGIQAALIGESLMREADVASKLSGMLDFP